MLEIFDYDSKLADESYGCMTNVNSINETCESDYEIQDTEDLHGFKISKWDRVCELLFEKDGRKFNFVIDADDYQEAIQRNKKAQLIKCAYFAAGDYLEGNDPLWIEKGGERIE